jgi:hypothetical protein
MRNARIGVRRLNHAQTHPLTRAGALLERLQSIIDTEQGLIIRPVPYMQCDGIVHIYMNGRRRRINNEFAKETSGGLIIG